MKWRYVKNSEIALLREVYDWEKAFPTFYKDANVYWRPTFEEAREFYSKCILYGLFEEQELVGLIYLEQFGSEHLNANLDLKRGKKIDPEIIEQVRDAQFRRGIKTAQVWVLKRNKPLKKVLEAAGFDETGLTMRQGSSHGRTLHWSQMVVATSF
jgi:hypothetical protein